MPYDKYNKWLYETDEGGRQIMKIRNDILWLDILALDKKHKDKLHLNDNEINLTQEDIELINSSKYVDLDKLKELLNKAKFTNFEIPDELGISKAMYSMAFGEHSKNKRGLRMRTIVAILNAIRNRSIFDPFDDVLIKEETINKEV